MLSHISGDSMNIVLGRFQPLHNGHITILEHALARGDTTIAIGSAQLGHEENNPWTGEERKQMLQAWLGNRTAEIVLIDDINDPPNWVEHAKKVHGEGVLVTSDEATAELYRTDGFEVDFVELHDRERLEGWRIRQTLTMLSTVGDDEALREVMAKMLPDAVIEWLIEYDGIYRLSQIAGQRPYTG
jgi:nicotinamide-nucleotide adenylyltransferase